MNGKRRRYKKNKLYKMQDGKCHWCGLEMILQHGEIPRHDRPHPRRATFEHLDDRWSARRGKIRGQRRIVLACYECNAKRGREREQQAGINELRDRAGHGARFK